MLKKWISGIIKTQNEKLGGYMQADIDEKQGEELAEKNGLESPSYLDPFYLERKKKKRKKKKPFPTDPDDPETDEDFDEEDDDDDDTDSSWDTDDAEDENELVQEVVKPKTIQQDPFVQMPVRPENIDLKRQADNPNKKQRSPLQKFFDVLLYGIQGAKLRNGDLSVKNSMFDELLLGLGFKAYLKDVIMNNQLIKYFKQKSKGKDDTSFLQRMFKAIKKRIIKDSELKSVLPDLQKQVEKAEKKSLTSILSKEVQKEVNTVEKKDIIQILKTPQRPAKVGAPVPKKESVAFTKDEAKQILLAVEKEEKRLREEEKRQTLLRQEAQKQGEIKTSSKSVAMVVDQAKMEIAAQASKDQAKMEMLAQKNTQMVERSNMQAERDQMMAQRVSAPIIPVSIVASQAEKDQAMHMQARTIVQPEVARIKGEDLGQAMAKLAEAGLAKGVQSMATKSPLGDIIRASETKIAAPENAQAAEATAVRVNEKGQATRVVEASRQEEQVASALSQSSRSVPTGPTIEEKVFAGDSKGK